MPSQIHELMANLSEGEGPRLSIYQRTHRRHPENQQDPIRYRNLLKEAEASLQKEYPACEAEKFLAPFRALAADDDFWNHTLDGLAVLGGVAGFRAVRLPQAVEDLVVVADSFHIKPLRRFLQTVDRFQILTVSRDRVRAFEGNRHVIDEIDLPSDVPQTIEDALGGELTEPRLTVASYGGASGNAMHHGHGGKGDEVDEDTERFFRVVDRAVLEHISRPSGLPLILAALPEHHHTFREVSQNSSLVPERVAINPNALSLDELREAAWTAMKPRYEERISALTDAFGTARAKEHGSCDIAEVGEAAAAGRVKTLLIEADRQIAGRVDPSTGAIETAELSDPNVDDLLDDLGELVEARGGDVYVIPAGDMPTDTGLAATYRY